MLQLIGGEVNTECDIETFTLSEAKIINIMILIARVLWVNFFLIPQGGKSSEIHAVVFLSTCCWILSTEQRLALRLAFFFQLHRSWREVKFAWTVFLLVLLLASTMDARRKDGRRSPFEYRENECTPCKGKLTIHRNPSICVALSP